MVSSCIILDSVFIAYVFLYFDKVYVEVNLHYYYFFLNGSSAFLKALLRINMCHYKSWTFKKTKNKKQGMVLTYTS